MLENFVSIHCIYMRAWRNHTHLSIDQTWTKIKSTEEKLEKKQYNNNNNNYNVRFRLSTTTAYLPTYERVKNSLFHRFQYTIGVENNNNTQKETQKLWERAREMKWWEKIKYTRTQSLPLFTLCVHFKNNENCVWYIAKRILRARIKYIYGFIMCALLPMVHIQLTGQWMEKK